jgi:hypothetical protein
VQALESAWQTGSAWRLAKHHRQTLTERILLRRAAWLRAPPSHSITSLPKCDRSVGNRELIGHARSA